MQPFMARPGATANIDSAGTTARVSLGEGPFNQVRVMNNGTATAWIRFGNGSVEATTAAGVPIGPGVTEVFSVASDVTHVALIAAGATGRCYFTPGVGV
jgi:hypothetical protein